MAVSSKILTLNFNELQTLKVFLKSNLKGGGFTTNPNLFQNLKSDQ